MPGKKPERTRVSVPFSRSFGHGLVLVGFDPSESSDRLTTPLTTEFPTPGIEVHAQILDSILTGRKLHEVPLWVSVAALLLTCLLVVGTFHRWRGWSAAAVFVATWPISAKPPARVLAGSQSFAAAASKTRSSRFLTGNVEANVGANYFLQGGYTVN
jgi:CHASE2 domain-containing sensor protein